MRIRCGTIHIVALAALAVGVAAGWFAALAWSPAEGFKIVDTHSTLVAFAAGSLGVSENVGSTSDLQDSKTPSSESNLNPAKPLKNSQAAANPPRRVVVGALNRMYDFLKRCI